MTMLLNFTYTKIEPHDRLRLKKISLDGEENEELENEELENEELEDEEDEHLDDGNDDLITINYD
jgi:hypothetical protein